MNNLDKQYIGLCEKIINKGVLSDNRTGIKTLSLFGETMRIDLSEGFPLLTTKKVLYKKVIDELLFFLSGSENLYDLPERSQNIWKSWASETGELKGIYGKQWRRWESFKQLSCEEDKDFSEKIQAGIIKQEVIDKGDYKEYFYHVNEYTKHEKLSSWRWHKITIDQIKKVIWQIKNNPNDRRIILTAWNVGEIEEICLPACHSFSQFYVREGKLSCSLYQRSCDVGLGLAFNIASYALLTHMIAQVCCLSVGDFVWTGGDVHLYENHIERIKEQIKKEVFELPTLKINPEVIDIDSFKAEDFEIIGYKNQGFIPLEVAI